MEDHGKGPAPLWAFFLGCKMKMVIPAPEVECEGGPAGLEGTGPGNHLCQMREKGQEEVGSPREGLSQKQGVRALLWKELGAKGF